MGWAARAKIRTGNPEPAAPSGKVLFINAEKHRDVFTGSRSDPKYARAQFSDREYLIDKHGTMRRATVQRIVQAFEPQEGQR